MNANSYSNCFDGREASPRPYPFSGEEKWWKGQLWRGSDWERRHPAGRRREASLGRHQKWRGRLARILFRCGRDARATLPSARCRQDAGAPSRYRAKSNLFRLSLPPPSLNSYERPPYR
ncbi:hypothetical protein Ga0100231_013415 [Opitutaceae bacterium TAV4]|nr:hypothetical protein Ga0100231_013415 [Opitutaceae bacterium TAV4]RRJ99411.1 hypothetical protein Ga0100230_014715 [Opitutaceae bacterium TAV3]